jgi:dTDP-4-dehydrorhamnose reductase
VDEVPGWGHLEPVNTTMVCSKIRNTFGIKQLPWRTWLSEEVAMLKTTPEVEPDKAPASS